MAKAEEQKRKELHEQLDYLLDHPRKPVEEYSVLASDKFVRDAIRHAYIQRLGLMETRRREQEASDAAD